jgi:hypothetical protein
MRSLFEKEEKEFALNQLKIDLISRFYPFTKKQVIQYKSVLNFDQHHLMNNEMVQWDFELLTNVCEKIDWSALWKIKNIRLDLAFFKKHESLIDFSSIHHSNNIEWSADLLFEYGDNFVWDRYLITKSPFSTVENLRQHKNTLDWSIVSRNINIEFTDEVLQEFAKKWDWKSLSANKNIPISVEFIQKYREKLDFDALSENPKSLELIYKYPTSKKWNWDKVILNPAISYNKESFDFVFTHYKRHYETKEFENPIFTEMALSSFLTRIFIRQTNDITYFLQGNFLEQLPWKILCAYCNTRLTLDFIENHKVKLNFKESEFIRNHRDVISKEFLQRNIHLFNPAHYTFYNLPLTMDLVSKLNDQTNWKKLSRCEKLDWTWDFIDTHFDKFNIFGLSENKGIFDKLVMDKLTQTEIFDFLNDEIKKLKN